MIIEFTLDKRSINEARNKLQAFKTDFVKKCDLLAKELADVGYETAYRIIGEHVFDGETLASLRADHVIGTDNVYVLSAQSEAILFLEFGSGLPAKKSPHPEAAEHGMGAGSFSPKGHWQDPNGWYYPTNDPRLINKFSKDGTQGYGHSKGMTPQMPFYTASRDIESKIAEVARRVFA